MTLSGKAKLAGVVGWPVSHSLSPRLHGHWLAEHRIDGAYVPLPLARERLAEGLAALAMLGFSGVNLTVPHKEAAFALAHEVDAPARAAGAVNLLIFQEGRFVGRNTDSAGLAASLVESLGADALRGKPVTMLGAGGAARAAVLALDQLGAGEVRVVNRDRHRAETLIRALTGFVAAKLNLAIWPDAGAGAALLINTTSAGMQGNSPLDISLDPLPTNAAVCDIVYNPLETALLRMARARGHRTVDGLGMLMHQAVPSFAALFGVTPRVTPVLRNLLEQALHG